MPKPLPDVVLGVALRLGRLAAAARRCATPPLNEKYGVPFVSSTQPISSMMTCTIVGEDQLHAVGHLQRSIEGVPSFQPMSWMTMLSGLPVSEVIWKTRGCPPPCWICPG